MKKTIAMLLTVVLVFVMLLPCFASTYVKGYYRSNGTYVAPHYRSSPNSTKLDNWSTKGNYNPYTGKTGTKNIYPNYNYTPNYSYTPSYRSSVDYGKIQQDYQKQIEALYKQIDEILKSRGLK
jgi:hypothetical protein